MPRPPNPVRANVRDVKMFYMVTQSEHDQIDKMATDQGMSMSGLVRKLLGLPPRY